MSFQTLFSKKEVYGLSSMTAEQSFALYAATGGKAYSSLAALFTAITAGMVLGSPVVFSFDHPLRVHDTAGLYSWAVGNTRDAAESKTCRVYEQRVLRSATNETTSKFYRLGSKVTLPGMSEELTVDSSMINGILFHDPVRPAVQALDKMHLRQSRLVKSSLIGGVKQEVSFIDKLVLGAASSYASFYWFTNHHGTNIIMKTGVVAFATGLAVGFTSPARIARDK